MPTNLPKPLVTGKDPSFKFLALMTLFLVAAGILSVLFLNLGN